MDENKYVWGMDGEIYILKGDMLNGKLLIHAKKRTRVFITGYYCKDIIYWEKKREYSSRPRYYLVDSAVLTDIELDQCPKWVDKAVTISEECYKYLRFGYNILYKNGKANYV